MLTYDSKVKTFKIDARIKHLDRDAVLRLIAEASDALVAESREPRPA